MYDELGRTWNKVVISCFKTFSHHLHGIPKEDHEVFSLGSCFRAGMCTSDLPNSSKISNHYTSSRYPWVTKKNEVSVSMLRIACLELFFFFFFFSLWGGMRLSPLGTSATNWPIYQPWMIDDECGAADGMRIGRGSRSTRRTPAPMPLCPPQIPHDLTWARTRATVVGSRRLTAWAMARPIFSSKQE
jgi:hypothetical protein